MSTFKGETIYLIEKVQTGIDDFNAPAYSETQKALDNVLVAPGARADIIESTRPEGVEINYTLYIPKGIEVKRNQELFVRSERVRAVGNPERYSPGNVTTEWDLVVEVTTSDG